MHDLTKDSQISKIINLMIQTDEEITAQSISTKSLFLKGGTISLEEAAQYIHTYIMIGFCQPKFYTRTAWNRANTLMKYGCKLGIIIPTDYGRGKGKYTTNLTIKEVIQYISKPIPETPKTSDLTICGLVFKNVPHA